MSRMLPSQGTPQNPLSRKHERVPKGQRQQTSRGVPWTQDVRIHLVEQAGRGERHRGWQRGGTGSSDLLSSSYWVRDTSLRLCTA